MPERKRSIRERLCSVCSAQIRSRGSRLIHAAAEVKMLEFCDDCHKRVEAFAGESRVKFELARDSHKEPEKKDAT
jgi:hypothetical protein